MKKDNKMSPEEVDELRKSLTTLNIPEAEIEDYIQKAIGEKKSSSEDTIEEKADAGEEEPEVEKSMSEEDIEKAYQALKSKKINIEKSIEEFEAKHGKKREVEKSLENDFEKSFGERFDDIEKSLTEKFSGEIDELNGIVKSLQAEIKKIGDTPMPFKSVMTKANFFEKSSGDDFSSNEDAKELSITRDKDELLKGMQDTLDKEKDDDIRQMLSDGISDYTVNTVPTTHGIRALAYLSRKKNITLGQ